MKLRHRRVAAHTVLAVTAGILITACSGIDPEAIPLILPAGDPALGRATYSRLGCGQCHEVRGEPELTAARRIALAPQLVRGDTKMSTGQWATAIVAPKHDVAWDADAEGTSAETNLERGEMPELFDRMTVGDLMDIVAFLERADS